MTSGELYLIAAAEKSPLLLKEGAERSEVGDLTDSAVRGTFHFWLSQLRNNKNACRRGFCGRRLFHFSISKNSASVNTGMPSSFALRSFEPAFSPATT